MKNKSKNKGSANGRAILNEKEVEEIRILYKSTEVKWTMRRLAALFGVSAAMVSNIINNRNWTPVEEADNE